MLALKGNDLYILMLTISIENLSGGMGTAAFIAYLSSLCNKNFQLFNMHCYLHLCHFLEHGLLPLQAGLLTI